MTSLGYTLVDFVTMILGENPVPGSLLYYKFAFIIFMFCFVCIVGLFGWLLISLISFLRR